jgi:outer membrane protein assembly factor BamB
MRTKRVNDSIHRVCAVTLALALLLPLGACQGGGGPIGKLFSSAKREKQTKLPGERVSVLLLQQNLEADPRLADIEVRLPPPYENADWPEPGGYASNSMYHLKVGEALERQWRAKAGAGADSYSRIMAPPIIADGRIFVLDAKCYVTALEEATGRELWHKSLAPKREKGRVGFGGGIAYDNGRIFVTTGFGRIHALDPADGKQFWMRDYEVPFHAAPTADGGRLFAVTNDNQLFVLAEDDGRELWSHQGISEQAGMLANSSPAIASDAVVVPYSSGELYAFRVQNGTVLWTDSLTRTGPVTPLATISDIAGRPVIDRGRVVAISHSGRLVSIDLKSGERIWTRDIDGIQTPWVAGDFIYLVTGEQELVCITWDDGRIRWITQLPQWRKEKKKSGGSIIWSGPLLASDRLIVVSSAGTAMSVSPYTGKILSEIKLGEGTNVAPVVAKSTVYILTDDARLLALR